MFLNRIFELFIGCLHQKMKIIDFYIRSSVHVSTNVVFLTLVTYYLFGISTDFSVLSFIFCSTLIGYNYTKYTNLLFLKKTSAELRIIQIITFVSLIFGVCSFFGLNLKSQILAVIIAILTILYALEIFYGKNIRNLSGIKIYVVAFCWLAITFFLPLFQAEYPINLYVLISGLQRFLLVIILLLIFEIIDLKEDALDLKTVPQTIGVKNTKIISILLLFVFFWIEFLFLEPKNTKIFSNSILSIVIFIFVVFATENRSKYYSTLWVESVPILWFLLITFN